MRAAILITAMAVGAGGGIARGQCPVTFTASESVHPFPDVGDNLGDSIAIDGFRAVAGQPQSDELGQVAGKVSFFEFTDSNIWEYFGDAVASDAAAGSHFGWSVSMDGGLALISAHLATIDENDNAGQAYVFGFDGGWSELVKIPSPDPGNNHQFGTAVGISGSTAVVGAPFDSVLALNAGRAYVFRPDQFNNWTQDAGSPLTPSIFAFTAEFGRSIAIDGNVIVVGAPGTSQDTGAVYVFRYDGQSWAEEQMLSASDGEEDDLFGWSVAVDGSVLVVGARADDDGGVNAGAVYVFRHDGSTWNQEAKLLGCEAGNGFRLGESVSINADLVVAGAPMVGGGRAQAYRYFGAHWAHVAQLEGTEPDDFDFFGDSVGVSGGLAVAGASFWDFTPAGAEGALFGFANLDTLPASCPGDTNGDGVTGINDFLAVLGNWGPCPGCPSDLDGDDVVGILDFLIVLGNWGTCHVVEY